MALGRSVGRLVLAAGMLMAGPALADSIDGDWCRQTKHFAIKGPTITTEGGKVVDGRYDRHGFAYVVPAGDPDPGSDIVMMLVNERTVHLWRKAPGGAALDKDPQVWQRCEIPSS